MMAPIPGATLDHWRTTLDTICTDHKFEPLEATPRSAIAASKIQYRCEPLPPFKHEKYYFGGFLQLDKDARISRIELEIITSADRGVDVVHHILITFGLPEQFVLEKFRRGDTEDPRYEDIFKHQGLSVSVMRNTGYTTIVNISITAA